MLELARQRGGDVDNPLKRDPLDFVLWQPSAADEPSWDTLWGPGRPGWHIECSALALRELGSTIHLHGGGTDLIFPHHECERAQSEAATGEPFVQHWMHTALISKDGEKMSKSLGNLVFVDALRKEWDAAAIRLGIIGHHYRTEWEWDEELMPSAQQRLEAWRAAARDGGAAVDVLRLVRERLDDDLDTPGAVAAIDDAVAGGGSGASVAAAADLARCAVVGGWQRIHRAFTPVELARHIGHVRCSRGQGNGRGRGAAARAADPARPLARWLWDIQLTGFDRLPAEGPAILCPNHISFLDSAFLMLSVPRNISFVGKAEYMASWKTKYLFPVMGMIPIDRSGGSKAAARARGGRATCCAAASCSASSPRGRAAGTAGCTRGAPGRRAWPSRSGAPIYPVGIVGTDRIQPPDARAPKLVGSCSITIGRPIAPAALRGDAGATPRAPSDDRRGDVRDPRAHRSGVRQSLCRQGRRCEHRAARAGPAESRRRLGATGASRPPTRQRGELSAEQQPPASPRRSLRRLPGDERPDHDHAARRFPPGVPGRDHRRGRRWIDRQASGQGRRRRTVGRRRLAHEVDLGRPLDDGDSVAIVTDDSEAGRHVLRHSTAHVMAQAVTQLFPGAKFSIGPAIENGFYYDFELPGGATFSDDDLAAIEARMREIVKADQPFVRSEVSIDEALDVFADQPYKVEIIKRVSELAPATGATILDVGEVDAGDTRERVPQQPGVRRSRARVRTCRRRADSATSSCRRWPGRTGAATRRVRCCSASTARHGSPMPRCRPISTSSSRPRSATTASSPTSST